MVAYSDAREVQEGDELLANFAMRKGGISLSWRQSSLARSLAVDASFSLREACRSVS